MTKYYYHTSIMPNRITPTLAYSVFDRTRAMFDLKDIEIFTPVGINCVPKSIEQMFYDRAQHILTHAGTRKINIAWSGGIDSTSILIEFIKHAPASQLVVMMNEASIAEYPEFYAKYIKGKLETRHLYLDKSSHLKDAIQDGIIVTGGLFDPLFGDDENYSSDVLSQSIEQFLRPLNTYTQEMYTKCINSCPRPLESAKDFLWWIGYVIDYQSLEFFWITDVEELILEDNIFHFCSNRDWNNWSVSTPIEVKYPGYDYRNFKIELKKQSYNFTKDEEYLKNKTKVKSFNTTRTFEEQRNEPIYITTDWKRGYRL